MGFDTTCYNDEDEHTVNELLTRRKEYKKKMEREKNGRNFY
jgi:hypothetical protein